MYRLGITLLCLSSVVVSCASETAETAQPPAAEEMLNKVNSLWSDREFAELDRYIASLVSAHPGYVPARIIEAEWLRRRGGHDLEAYLQVMSPIAEMARQHMHWFSPLALGFIQGAVSRAQNDLKSEESAGRNREYRQEHFAPEKLSQLGNWNNIADLVLVAPALTVPSDTNQRPVLHYPKEEAQGITVEEARALIESRTARGPERAEAVRFLAKGSPPEQLTFLVPRVRDWAPEVAEAAAEAVSGYGEAALPHIIAEIEDKATRGNREFCMWALLRIESDSEQIENTLQKFADSMDHSERKYAEEALAYLRSRKR